MATDLKPITVETTINAPVEKTWKCFSEPAHITKWAFASPDWHAPRAENDLRTGGKFVTEMAAKDGSVKFDFEGVYDDVQKHKVISYKMSDGRKVRTVFSSQGDSTKVTQTFDPESENPADMQRAGWQAILDNFKKHTEGK
jgi:uncharacterized protein YndB with AHSA1/START domain